MFARRRTLKSLYSTIKQQITFTDAFYKALQVKLAHKPKNQFLRLQILAGEGCEGFTYKFKFDSNLTDQDFVLKGQQQKVVFALGEEQLTLVRGATLNYVREMMRESFQVKQNPNAQISCSCKTSFSPKDFLI